MEVSLVGKLCVFVLVNSHLIYKFDQNRKRKNIDRSANFRILLEKL